MKGLFNVKKLRAAIIGCGGMGGGHAVAIAGGGGRAVWKIREMPERVAATDPYSTDISKKLELAGVYDIDPVRNEWAANLGFHVYKSYEDELNDPGVDIILVATPNHLHKDMAIAAMRAGKHVLCEKPVTPSGAELEEVLKAAAETGKVFYPRQNRRWDKDYLIAKKIYSEKLVGDVFNIESRIMGSRGIPGDWRGVKAYGGGMMLDWGVHLLDRLLMMIPEQVDRVYCSLTYITNKECDDGFKMQITFKSGLTASLEIGTCHFIGHPIWYLAGKNGTAVIEDWAGNGRIVRLKSWEDRDAGPVMAGTGLTKTMAPRESNSVEAQKLPEVLYDKNELYSNLADTINGKARQMVTGEQALRVMKLIEAAFESAKTRTVVRFE